ncbi:MAG TPA: S41 family peptidase [Gemmataceae bacterium]|nr:S41 family peptidase [Gemmataceae bacterium]
MSRWNLAWLVGVAAVVSLGLAVSQSAPSRDRDKDYELVRLVVDVMSEVDHRYVRELDDKAKRKLVEDMINGGLERLDPHSQFINPRRFRQFTKDSRGQFGGIGIQISTDRQTGALAVVSPLAGTPAYDAGIVAGDLIVKINGTSTENMHVNDAVDLIQGEPGQPITLAVLHPGAKKPVELSMKRALIRVACVLGDVRKADDPGSWEYFIDKPNRIAYLRLTAFTEDSADEMTRAVRELKAQGVRGLILDLRTDPGGLLKDAVEISNLFIADGRIVSTRGRDREEEVFDARADRAILPSKDECPMAVLVNKFSASASEIVSAALQDHHRAVIIGERSYGKGSVQNVIRMEGGRSALKLTTASYWRPSGKNIHRFPDSKETDEWGVKPDKGFAVPMEDDERLEYMLYRRDRDIIHGKPGTASITQPEKKKPSKKKPFEDRVLKKALEYLHGQMKKAQALGELEMHVG